MSDTIEYIFCPLCGEHNWMSDKTGSTSDSRLTLYKCTACKKFTYINASSIVKTTFLHAVTQLRKYSVKAEISDYLITVLYDEGETVIRDTFSKKEILTINKAIDFNWYNTAQVMEKVKFYLVFS